MPRVEPVDPFDLPEWLGAVAVTWAASSSLDAPVVSGVLSGEAGEPSLDCDVLAADLAVPVAALGDDWRGQAQRAWSLGEVLLLRCDGRLTLAAPGERVGVEAVLDAVRRLARAVAAPAGSWSVALRL